jgi:hypothetical protein
MKHSLAKMRVELLEDINKLEYDKQLFTKEKEAFTQLSQKYNDAYSVPTDKNGWYPAIVWDYKCQVKIGDK